MKDSENVIEENCIKMRKTGEKSTNKKEEEEAQNRLIQAVLREYFP
jgi:hypothetical protein